MQSVHIYIHISLLPSQLVQRESGQQQPTAMMSIAYSHQHILAAANSTNGQPLLRLIRNPALPFTLHQLKQQPNIDQLLFSPDGTHLLISYSNSALAILSQSLHTADSWSVIWEHQLPNKSKPLAITFLNQPRRVCLYQDSLTRKYILMTIFSSLLVVSRTAPSTRS
jgi:hypothetical protein